MIVLGIYGALGWETNPKKLHETWIHGASISLFIDGKHICSVEEERFTRAKYDGNFPTNSLENVFKRFNLTYDDVDVVAFCGNCCLENNRKKQKKEDIDFLKKIFKNAIIKRYGHHQSHAAACFFSSPFKEANVITFDNGGDIIISFGPDRNRESGLLTFEDGQSTSFGIGTKPFNLMTIRKYTLVNAFGRLFDGFSTLVMSRVRNESRQVWNSLVTHDAKAHEENPGKVMGLSAYGEKTKIKIPVFYGEIKNGQDDLPEIVFDWIELIKFVKEKYYDYKPEDYASVSQFLFEETFLAFLRGIPKSMKSDYLCLGGGCALNILLNTKIIESGLYKDVYVFPATNDSGLSYGAALSYLAENEIEIKLPKNLACVGIDYDEQTILNSIEKNKDNIIFEKKTFEEICDLATDALKDNKIIGWFQGKSEYGPRALGNRSILANPSFDNKGLLNEKVKFREYWRPYAGMVMEEYLHEWFDIPKKDSHYMLFNSIVKEDKREKIKSVTHVDNSCRIQSVTKEINFEAYELLKKFNEKTGIPVLLNTSFNTIPGEPIVETPGDAIKSFLYSKIDILFIGNYMVTKK